MLNEFKTFIARGNVLDLAVGVVIGAAFTAIVTSLVGDIINPLIGLIAGGVDFSGLSFGLGDAQFMYGNFINAIIKFLIVAWVVFLIVKAVNRPRVLIQDIMSREPVCVSPDAPMSRLGSLLEKGRLRAILITERGRFCGLVTAAEYRKAALHSRENAPAKAFMRTRIPVLHPAQNVRDALHAMTNADCHLLPVVERDEVVGVVTRADLMLHIYQF